MYSAVSKYGPNARKTMTYRSTKGKSCGYYMRIVFLFSSLIQSLIIVSLVLFLVYGKQQDSASVSRIQDLEMRYSQLSMETVSLRQQRKNLTHLLNITVQDKTRNEWDLVQLRRMANASYFHLFDMDKKMKQCEIELKSRSAFQPAVRTMNQFQPYQPVVGCNCGMEMETCKAKLELVQSNFTQTAMKMQMEMDQMAVERDRVNLEAIQLRRDKFVHEKAIELYQIKCKDEFVNSLSGITNVSKAFLNKIDSLFPELHRFQLTCPKQKEYLDQIRNNCTNLSEEVVRKFQKYLDSLGDKVSMSTGNISVLTAENIRMTRDYNLCSQNRTGLIREHRQHVDRIQLKNDEEKEKLLKEKMKLNGDIEVLEISVKYKNSELEHLKQQLKHLNMSCMPRTGGGFFPRPVNQPGSTLGLNTGSSSSGLPNSGGLNQFSRNSYGSSPSSSSNSHGSPFGSTGSNPGLGSTNTGFNKPSSTGLGSSSLGSNSGLGSSGLNKPGSSNTGSSSLFGSTFGLGSSGTGLNKPASTGLGSSSFGSSNNPSSSSSNQNKFGFGSSGATGASSSNSNFGSSNSNFGSSNSNSGSSNSNFGSSNSNSGSSNSNFGSSNSGSSNFGSSNSNSGSSNFGSSNSNSGSSNSNFGSSNFGSSNSNSGSSNSNSGSSLSKFGSSSSNLGSSNSKFGSSSTNLGSSSSNNFGSSSSSNFGSSSNSNFGSSSSSLSKTTSNSRGSSLFGSSSSSNSNLGSSSSSSQNKMSSSTSKSSPSSSSSSSSSSPTALKGLGWWLSGGSTSSSSSSSNSNSDQSKLGSNQGRSSSSSGTGFGSFGSGRSNSFAFTGPISYNEHMRDLQRIISPPGPEERQELSRMMG